ncbi:MAG: hypothetical protein RLZZ306_3546 [Bacteroidota bacterium]|jgi:hypothetical protein
MKKLLFFLFLSTVSYTSTYAQDPIVIKQDSSVRDLDEPVDVRDLPFRQRLKFGGGIGGLQFGNPTVVGISPMVGYQATNDLIVGLAVDYQYQGGTLFGQKYSINQYGPRLFGQYRLHLLENILSGAFLQGELQKYYASSQGRSVDYDVQALAGVGVGFGGFNLTVLYNLNYNEFTSPYGSPLVIRVGGFFF